MALRVVVGRYVARSFGSDNVTTFVCPLICPTGLVTASYVGDKSYSFAAEYYHVAHIICYVRRRPYGDGERGGLHEFLVDAGRAVGGRQDDVIFNRAGLRGIDGGKVVE